MKCVQLGRGMLWSFKIRTSRTRKFLDLRGRQDIGHENNAGLQRHMGSWQHAGGLRRNHCLAAVMALVGRITGHGATALHALLVLGRCEHTVGKLQAQQGHHCHGDKHSLAHWLNSTLG